MKKKLLFHLLLSFTLVLISEKHTRAQNCSITEASTQDGNTSIANQNP